ncbi:hypothetical protein [Candidatus Phytoplasma oryzae]|nr:hypothetical protein PIE28_02075 [Candidatus Phytoplasma oryzae]
MLNKVQFKVQLAIRRFFASSVLLFFLLFIPHNFIKANQNSVIEAYFIAEENFMLEQISKKQDRAHEIVRNFSDKMQTNDFAKKNLSRMYDLYVKYVNLIDESVKELTSDNCSSTSIGRQRLIQCILRVVDRTIDLGQDLINRLEFLESVKKQNSILKTTLQKFEYDRNQKKEYEKKNSGYEISINY